MLTSLFLSESLDLNELNVELLLISCSRFIFRSIEQEILSLESPQGTSLILPSDLVFNPGQQNSNSSEILSRQTF